MNRAKHRGRCVKWARYVNRYGHIPEVIIGGWGAVRAMNYGPPRSTYYRVRYQQKHPFMKGYRVG